MTARSRLSLVLLALAAAIAFSACSSGPKSPAAVPTAEPEKAKVAAKGRVAIFDFEVKGGGGAYASLSGDIPESLSESFIKGGLVVPVERKDLEKAIAEQELAVSGLVDEATAARVGRLAGARYALLGSASIIGDQVRLSCRLIDIETAEILYAKSAYGETKVLFKVLEKLAAEVEDGFSK
jgi:curli biogenesis system outer membrane secretion channel CsgG